jgi:DNA-binding MarR family transcriptional regulator
MLYTHEGDPGMYRLIGSLHTLSGLPGAISDFLRAMDSVRKALATEAGLSANELRAMSQIAETDGVTPKRLADDLELTTGAITAITNGLVARELVHRVQQGHDRRSLLLHLTDSGHAMMETVYERFQHELGAAAEPLDPADEAALIRSLSAMTAVLRNDD